MLAAMAVPIARGIQRFDALLIVVDGADGPTRITASVNRRHLRPMMDRMVDRFAGTGAPERSHCTLMVLLAYVAVVVTVVAVRARRAIDGLAAVTKPTLAISTVTLGALDGIQVDSLDAGVRASVVAITSPLSLRLAEEVSYDVQTGEHDHLVSGLSSIQAAALLRDRCFDERTFAIPHLSRGAHFHPGQDVLVAAMTMPVARTLHRLEAVLVLVDAAGRRTRFTATLTDRRRLRPPIDAADDALAAATVSRLDGDA